MAKAKRATQEILPPAKVEADTKGANRPNSRPWLKPWKPGQSGNPNGLRGSHYSQAIQLSRQFGPIAIQQMIDMCVVVDETTGETVPNLRTEQRIRAVLLDKLADRAFGKPKEMKDEDMNRVRPNLSVLSGVELATLRQLMAKATLGALQPASDQASAGDAATSSHTDSNGQASEADAKPTDQSVNGADTTDTP